MPLSTTLIVAIGSIAVGISLFAIYLVQKLIKQMKDEEKDFDEAKAREVKKTYDFLSKKKEVKEKPKKTLGEVELKV